MRILNKTTLLLLCIHFLFCMNAYAGKRVALVIGNGDYKSCPLRNPVNDAKDMGKALNRLGFDVILATDSSLRSMEEYLEEFVNGLRGAEAGMFFFAGHGVQSEGENYLIPVDADIKRERDLQYEALPLGKILGGMEAGGAKINIVVLDACRNNPFAREFRSGQRGLAVVQDVKGAIIAYATAPGAVAQDGAGRNGIFTENLLKNLPSPNLGIESVFKRTRIQVSNETGGEQIPWTSSSLMGDFYFNTKGTPLPPASPMEANKAPIKNETKSRGEMADFAGDWQLQVLPFTQNTSRGMKMTMYSNVQVHIDTNGVVRGKGECTITEMGRTVKNVNREVVVQGSVSKPHIKTDIDKPYKVAEINVSFDDGTIGHGELSGSDMRTGGMSFSNKEWSAKVAGIPSKLY